jgi:ribonuclease HI
LLAYKAHRATNNQAELLAVIFGLSEIPAGEKVRVCTDSAYVVRLSGNLQTYAARHWMKAVGTGHQRLANRRLLKQLLKLVQERTVEFVKVLGHADILGNELANALAFRAAHRKQPVASWWEPLLVFKQTDSLDTPRFASPASLPESAGEREEREVRETASRASYSPRSVLHEPSAGRGTAAMKSTGAASRRIGVDAHVGNYVDFVDRYQLAATEAAEVMEKREKTEEEEKSLKRFLGKLFDRCTDFRMLRRAWDICEAKGDTGPGVDGLRFDITCETQFEILRGLSDRHSDGPLGEPRGKLPSGRYRPDQLRPVDLPKPDGGIRPLDIPTATDRVISRAILMTLTPLLDPTFKDGVVGFRPYRSPLEGLARACRLTKAGFTTWLTADLAQAFTSVPKATLIEAVQERVPNAKLASLIERIVRRPLPVHPGRKANGNQGTPGIPRRQPSPKRGIPQGDPLSPFLLNLFLDKFLDRPWADAYPAQPMLRYADDLLVLTGNTQEATAALNALRESVSKNTGMALKESKVQIVDLAGGETADWLGFTVRLDNSEPRLSVGPEAWSEMQATLKQAASIADTERLSATLAGYLQWFGPAWDSTESIDALITKLRTWNLLPLLPSEATFIELALSARNRWCRILVNASMSEMVRPYLLARSVAPPSGILQCSGLQPA